MGHQKNGSLIHRDMRIDQVRVQFEDMLKYCVIVAVD